MVECNSKKFYVFCDLEFREKFFVCLGYELLRKLIESRKINYVPCTDG